MILVRCSVISCFLDWSFDGGFSTFLSFSTHALWNALIWLCESIPITFDRPYPHNGFHPPIPAPWALLECMHMCVCVCVYVCVCVSVDHSWLEHHGAWRDDHPGQRIMRPSCGEVQDSSSHHVLGLLPLAHLDLLTLGPPLRCPPKHGHHWQAQGRGGECRGEQGGLGQSQRRAVEGQDGRASQAAWRRVGATQRAEVQGTRTEGRQGHGATQALQSVASQKSSRCPWDDDVGSAHEGQLWTPSAPKPSTVTPLQQRAHPTGGALLLSHKVTVGFDVLAEGAGVCVALQAAHHLAVVRLVHVVCARVFEAIAGVGVTLVATLIRTNVGLFTCRGGEGIQMFVQNDKRMYSVSNLISKDHDDSDPYFESYAFL